VLVYFVGGATQAEVAALRFWAQRRQRQHLQSLGLSLSSSSFSASNSSGGDADAFGLGACRLLIATTQMMTGTTLVRQLAVGAAADCSLDR
jgi:hypothetical protein